MTLEEALKQNEAVIKKLEAEIAALKRELDLLRNPNTFISTRMGTIKIK